MNKSLHYGSSSVYDLRYHIIICTKYRKPVITEDVASDFISILDNIAVDYKFSIVAVKSGGDHIHMLLDCTPTNYIPDIIKAIKGRSSRILRQIHPSLLELGKALWSPSYFIRTISDADGDTVTQYINSQTSA